MNVVYIQDQPVYRYKDEYFHPKSANFYFRYLSGLNKGDKLFVYARIIDINDNVRISKYEKVSHPMIEFRDIPETRNLKNIFCVYKRVKTIVNDVDFCYLRTGLASSFASYFCKWKGIPYMAIINEDIYKNTKAHSSLFVRLSAYPLRYLNRHLVKLANYACYVTKNYLQEHYPCDGETLGCSDIEFLDIKETALQNRINHIRKHTGKVVLGSIGLVTTAIKGQDTVIKALSLLKKQGYDNYEYRLVGGGSSMRLQGLAIEFGVGEQVKFLGEFSHDDVLKWFDEIDIYLHPSRSEGLPRTILEAMTKATPCICSNVGGIPELISPECMFAYNGNEVESAASLILKMDNNKMIEQAKRNFEKSKEYDPNKLSQIRGNFFIKAINKLKV